ncbi:MAG: hypothetical protein AB7R89_18880 [Dehalococcoidia bacterium]
MTAHAPQPRYVVYGDGGATLVYSGTDDAEYAAARRLLEATHAGALVGQSMMGRERWIIVSYHHDRPDDQHIRRRREGGLLGLAWESAGNGAIESE